MNENNEITTAQYLEAVSIIEAFHCQIKGKIKDISDSTSETLREWLVSNEAKCSGRLKNNLKALSGDWNPFVKDLLISDFKMFRNIGEKSLKEAIDLGLLSR